MMIVTASPASTSASSSSSTMTTVAVFGIIIGHWLGKQSLDDMEQFVSSILVPLYGCLVATYITIRIYHIVIEPKFIDDNNNNNNKKKQQPSSKAIVVPKSIPTTGTTIATGNDNDQHQNQHQNQPVDLSGPWQLVQNEGFEDILAAQGVPWALRSAANKCRPIHRISHQGNTLTIKIEGIIESQTTYKINGPPQQIEVRGRAFEDTVTYISNGVQTIKRAIHEGYSVQVHRVLIPSTTTTTTTTTTNEGNEDQKDSINWKDSNTLMMYSTVQFDDPSKDDVSCTQTFERIMD